MDFMPIDYGCDLRHHCSLYINEDLKMKEDSRNIRRPTIYLNEALLRVKTSIKNGRGLSRRLGVIAERYEMICSNPPKLTSEENGLLAMTLAGRNVDPMLIKYLDTEISSTDTDGPVAARLAVKVRDMTLAERVSIIESLGL